MSQVNDLAIEARNLALQHIRSDVEHGQSEQDISNSWHTSSGPEFYGNDPTRPCKFGAYDVRVAGNKVVVSKVHSVEIRKSFSLHELYLECQQGQQSLL